MPPRLNAKGPGEFIRDHLEEPSTGGRDYVGPMYQAYKDHLRSAGVRHLPCRPTFHKYVWLLKEVGAIVFDGAQAIPLGTTTNTIRLRWKTVPMFPIHADVLA